MDRISELENMLQQKNDKLNKMEQQLTNLEEALKSATDNLSQPLISVEKIKHSDSLIQLHTGLPTYQHFKWIFNQVETAANRMRYCHWHTTK